MSCGCPICGVALEPVARYPRYVCRTCASRARSRDGRPLEFFNLGLSGGYGARYADDHAPYQSHDCFIDGHPCRADEARFGGIVIEQDDPEPNWSMFSDQQLLSAYCSLMATLKNRGITRSANNPVADYTESLVSRVLGLSLEVPSRAGFDAIGADGNRYQIKGRRLTTPTAPPQLGAIRNLDKRPFDLLAAVAFDAGLSVLYAGLVPIEVVIESSRYSSHTNSHIFFFRRSVLDDPRVRDLTTVLTMNRVDAGALGPRPVFPTQADGTPPGGAKDRS